MMSKERNVHARLSPGTSSSSSSSFHGPLIRASPASSSAASHCATGTDGKKRTYSGDKFETYDAIEGEGSEAMKKATGLSDQKQTKDAGKEEEEEGEGCSALSSEMACKKGTGVVWSLDWADDGATLACGSSNQTVQLLDAAAGDKARGGGQQQQPLDVIKELCGHRGVVRSVAWTRRECTTRRRLASAGDDSLVIVWQ
mmetsp:Transcript_31521/g.53310  ORF Transcript_31521/g.53310 Transcript_31521/m.53310 type:complete len:199 (+) Transcript_31521:942-1538(+)